MCELPHTPGNGIEIEHTARDSPRLTGNIA
jgi:hypothetical protein